MQFNIKGVFDPMHFFKLDRYNRKRKNLFFMTTIDIYPEKLLKRNFFKKIMYFFCFSYLSLF